MLCSAALGCLPAGGKFFMRYVKPSFFLNEQICDARVLLKGAKEEEKGGRRRGEGKKREKKEEGGEKEGKKRGKRKEEKKKEEEEGKTSDSTRISGTKNALRLRAVRMK